MKQVIQDADHRCRRDKTTRLFIHLPLQDGPPRRMIFQDERRSSEPRREIPGAGWIACFLPEKTSCDHT